MKKYFYSVCENYADEFDYAFFELFTEDELIDLRKTALMLSKALDEKKIPEEIEIYFGTNEFFTWDTDALLTLFIEYESILTELPNTDEQVLDRLFPYGFKKTYHKDAIELLLDILEAHND